MKPYEEDWIAEGNGVRRIGGYEFGSQYVGQGFTLDRARLAAQAPRMAQALLAVQKEFEAEKGRRLTVVDKILRDAGVLP